MSGTEPVAGRVDEDTASAVEHFQERHGYDSRSEAVGELVKIGIRETRAPVLHRWRNNAIDAAYHLFLVGVVTGVAGWATTLLAPAQGARVAVVLWLTSLALVAAVEVPRSVVGCNELGSFLRGGRS